MCIRDRADADDTFIRELCEYHVSGQLKVAPEHVSDAVLSVMGKPGNAVYERFRARYARVNADLGKKQYLVPYLMSSHPGSTLKEAVELAEYCRDLGYMPEQVQDFYPTPSTISTCMYYTCLLYTSHGCGRGPPSNTAALSHIRANTGESTAATRIFATQSASSR